MIGMLAVSYNETNQQELKIIFKTGLVSSTILLFLLKALSAFRTHPPERHPAGGRPAADADKRVGFHKGVLRCHTMQWPAELHT